jgi:hypothetical protein
MHAAQNTKTCGLLAMVPLAFGFTGLGLCVVYQAQRSDMLPYSLDRFIQHHLDAIAGFSMLAALLGVVAGLATLRLRGRSRLLTFGTILSVVVLLWCLFGLSL